MKKLLVALATWMLIIIPIMVFAGQANTFNNQTGLRPSSMTSLMTGSTGTTVGTYSSYAIFDYPYTNWACDIITGPAMTIATNVTVTIYSNVTGTSLFDLTNPVITATTVTPSATINVLRTVHPTAGTVIRSLYALITAQNPTVPVTINCGATQ